MQSVTIMASAAIAAIAAVAIWNVTQPDIPPVIDSEKDATL